MSIHDFTCKDCKTTYPSAEEFSNHFRRADGSSIEIIGCKDRVKERVNEKTERPA